MHSLDIKCAYCEKLLAIYEPKDDSHQPTCDEIYVNGAVPIPNFGWFCSQECGNKWEIARGKTYFQRDEKGEINYD